MRAVFLTGSTNMQSFILDSLLIWPWLGYLLIFLLSGLEGDITLFSVGFLVGLGFFDPGQVFLVVLVGRLVGDGAWYWLGYTIKQHNNFFTRWLLRLTKSFDEHITNRPIHTFIVSKFTYGIHHAILARAGVLKINLRRFFEVNLLADLIWIIVVGGLGYASGAGFVLVKGYLHYAELALLAGIVIFLTIWHFVFRLSKKQL